MSSKHNVVICLADPTRAAGLAESLGSKDDIEPVVAASSDELHHIVNYQRIDLIVLEHKLRGFLTGLDIFERMFDDLLRPVTLLLADAGAEIRERAQQLGINRILPGQATIPEIREMVEGLISTSKISKIVIPSQARQIVQRCSDIKPLPQLLIKLTGYLDAESVSLTELANDISVDPRITAELLKVINSTAFGLNRRITRLYDAINLLGVRRTVSLIISSSVIDAQAKLSDSIPEPEGLWFNLRSVLIASAASTFAHRLEGISPDTAYVLGLFQDLGILVLAKVFSGKYVQLLRRVRKIGQLRLDLCEREEFKISHGEVSAAILQKWNMPASIVSMVLAHHDSSASSDLSRTDRKFLRVMRIGEAIADLSDGHSPQRFPALAQLLSEYSLSRADQCRAGIAESVEKSLESSKLFSLPVPDDFDMQQMAAQMQGENWNTASWPESEQEPCASWAGVANDSAVASPGAPEAPASQVPPASPANNVSPPVPSPWESEHAAPPPPPMMAEPNVAAPVAPEPPPPFPTSAKEKKFAGPKGMRKGNVARSPEGEAALGVNGPLKIVIFEDELMVVDYIRLCLKQYPIEVQGFDRYETAREALAEAGLIFVDLHLGEFMGTDVVRSIRATGNETPIIIISGDRRREVVAAAILAGANDFLIKPFDQATLLKRIGRHTGKILV